jgi:hypothetical protein
MKVISGKATILDNIDWGTPFLFRLRESNYVGVKVFRSAGSNRAAFVAVIWPHHPNVPGEVGILDGGNFGGKALVPIDDAVLVRSKKFEDLRLNDAVTIASGSILLFENHGPIMPVRYSEERIWFADLEAGELLEHPPGRIVAEVVKWALVQKSLDGFDVLCEFTAAPKT